MSAQVRNLPFIVRTLTVLVVLSGFIVAIFLRSTPASPIPPVASAARPALTVAALAPERADWPHTLSAVGNVVAWQEAVIGAEIDNYRITEVYVQVGDRVRKGQLLARIAADTVLSEMAEAQAGVAEQSALAAETAANAARARELRARGFYSAQLDAQYQTAERTAAARLEAARARLQAASVKAAKTEVSAPDDGVISGTTAVVGSLTRNSQELFRLIRGARLEWRAEAPSAELGKLRPGAAATLTGPDGATLTGKVRQVAPSVDVRTRNGLVYVDLPAAGSLRAGMFVRGEIDLGTASALSLPQAAVVLRDGFAFVFVIGDGAGDLRRITQTRVTLGRRLGERVEIRDGISHAAQVVASGAGFLSDGDSVRLSGEGNR